MSVSLRSLAGPDLVHAELVKVMRGTVESLDALLCRLLCRLLSATDNSARSTRQDKRPGKHRAREIITRAECPRRILRVRSVPDKRNKAADRGSQRGNAWITASSLHRIVNRATNIVRIVSPRRFRNRVHLVPAPIRRGNAPPAVIVIR